MKKLVKYLEFLKEHKLYEGGGAGIEFKCDMYAYGKYKITKDDIEVIETKAEPGEKFNAHGYDDGMSNVITDKVLYVDDNGLKNPSRSALLDLELSFDYNGELCEFLESVDIKSDSEFDSDDDATEYLSKKLSIKSENLTFANIFELSPDAEFIMSIEISGEYKEMHFAGWSRGEFSEGDSVMSETDNFNMEVSVNDKYTVWLKNENDLGSFVPALKAKKEFSSFYKNVFSINSDDIKLNAFQSKEYAVIVDGKIVSLVDDEDEGQNYLDENGYDTEVYDTKIIPTSEIKDVDDYEYNLTDTDYEWYYDDLRLAWQQDI